MKRSRLDKHVEEELSQSVAVGLIESSATAARDHTPRQGSLTQSVEETWLIGPRNI